MTTPALTANLDQLAACARDIFAWFGVDVEDPAQVRAIQATWSMVAGNPHSTPWVLAAIAQAIPLGE